jgi:hypothetical protein
MLPAFTNTVRIFEPTTNNNKYVLVCIQIALLEWNILFPYFFSLQKLPRLVSSQQNTSEHLQAVKLTPLLKDGYQIMKKGCSLLLCCYIISKVGHTW